MQEGGAAMRTLTRITFDPQVMGGKPCIRGMRVTAGAPDASGPAPEKQGTA